MAAEGDLRDVIRYAWIPVRIEGRWCWRTHYVSTERLEPDYAGSWDWLPIRRSLLP